MAYNPNRTRGQNRDVNLNKIEYVVEDNFGITIAEVARATGLSVHCVYVNMNILKNQGRVSAMAVHNFNRRGVQTPKVVTGYTTI